MFFRISPAFRISRELRSAGVTRHNKSNLSAHQNPLSRVNLGQKSELRAHRMASQEGARDGMSVQSSLMGGESKELHGVLSDGSDRWQRRREPGRCLKILEPRTSSGCQRSSEVPCSLVLHFVTDACMFWDFGSLFRTLRVTLASRLGSGTHILSRRCGVSCASCCGSGNLWSTCLSSTQASEVPPSTQVSDVLPSTQ